MLFHIFNSQEERRNYGGSAFIEIQFCKLPCGTKTKKLVAVNSIEHFKNDSLYIYVEDIDTFYEQYNQILDSGTYNNLNRGTVDIYGINYYAPPLINLIIERLNKDKPIGYEIFVEWLNESKEYNGFYILGI